MTAIKVPGCNHLPRRSVFFLVRKRIRTACEGIFFGRVQCLCDFLFCRQKRVGIQTACRAFRINLYIRKNSDELSVDENKIIVCGFSAGGHMPRRSLRELFSTIKKVYIEIRKIIFLLDFFDPGSNPTKCHDTVLSRYFV